MTYFPGPSPAYTNPPIEPQNFQPNQFVITSIALGKTTTVTTATAPYRVVNNYVIGQLVRFIIPPTYGTRQLDEQSGYVIAIPTTNEFVVDINSTTFDAFIPSPSYGPTPAQVVAIGDIANGTINSSGRVNNGMAIPGSFINISPN